MVRRSSVLILASLLLLGATAPAKSPSVTESVQGFVRKYIEAANAADITTMMSMVSQRSGVASIGDGEITRGWEAIRKENDEAVGQEGTYKFSLGSIDVLPLGASNALAFAPYAATLATEQGTVQLSGAVTLVLEKSAGVWKLLHEHTSFKAASP